MAKPAFKPVLPDSKSINTHTLSWTIDFWKHTHLCTENAFILNSTC